MKHPYKADCECARCTKERARRDGQARRDALNAGNRRFYKQPTPIRRRPAPGSQEWAESRGGLIGGYETDDTYCPD